MATAWPDNNRSTLVVSRAVARDEGWRVLSMVGFLGCAMAVAGADYSRTVEVGSGGEIPPSIGKIPRLACADMPAGEHPLSRMAAPWRDRARFCDCLGEGREPSACHRHFH